jgi:hypothetical protein
MQGETMLAGLIEKIITDMRVNDPFAVLAAACRCLPAATASVKIKADRILPPIPVVSSSSILDKHAPVPSLASAAACCQASPVVSSTLPAAAAAATAMAAVRGVPLCHIGPPLLGLTERYRRLLADRPASVFTQHGIAKLSDDFALLTFILFHHGAKLEVHQDPHQDARGVVLRPQLRHDIAHV